MIVKARTGGDPNSIPVMNTQTTWTETEVVLTVFFVTFLKCHPFFSHWLHWYWRNHGSVLLYFNVYTKFNMERDWVYCYFVSCGIFLRGIMRMVGWF